jgi:serine phosphatase RsbU (regulator of sigma subunit)
VSGKGIPAALILSSLKALFRTMAHDTADPAAIAERMSAALYEEYAGLPYATAIVARFERAPGRLAYVNAGHPAGYLLRKGTVTPALESGGQPLGLLPAATYATANVELHPGDIGVLVTDGMTEALEAGPTTLAQVLEASAERLAAGRSPGQVCDDLLRAAAAGPGPAGVPDWQDDRTVFVFAVEPVP